MLCLRPGPVLFWTGRRSACPGAVDHAARLDRSRPPWACYALRGLRSIFPGPLELERVSRDRWTISRCAWSACAGSPDAGPGPCSLGELRPPWPVPRLPWAGPPGRLDRCRGRLRRGRRSRRGSANRPPRFCHRDFPPRIGPGFSPVTRAAGDSPAHNARPRRSPRNAISINHRNMKSTNFMQVRLHKI